MCDFLVGNLYSFFEEIRQIEEELFTILELGYEVFW
jgi:hypothetical protein